MENLFKLGVHGSSFAVICACTQFFIFRKSHMENIDLATFSKISYFSLAADVNAGLDVLLIVFPTSKCSFILSTIKWCEIYISMKLIDFFVRCGLCFINRFKFEVNAVCLRFASLYCIMLSVTLQSTFRLLIRFNKCRQYICSCTSLNSHQCPS